MLGRIITALRRIFSPTFGPGPGPLPLLFRQIDIGSAARELGLADRGTANGSREQPPSRATLLDTVEQRIVSYVQSEADMQKKRVLQEVGVYNARLSSFGFLLQAQMLEGAGHTAEMRLRSYADQIRDELAQAEATRDAAAKAYGSFREVHGLLREARLSSSIVLHVGLVLLVFLVEIGMNTFFFGQGHEFGLFGGFAYALAFSVVNIGMALAVGFSAGRYVRYRFYPAKLYAYLGCLSYVVFLLALNLAIGHYRDLMQSDLADEAGTRFVAQLVASPFGLASFDSWLLVTVGIALAALAFFEAALFIDEPYPHYSRIARRWRASEAVLANARQQARDALENVHQETIERMDGLLAGLDQAIQQYAHIKTYRDSLIGQYAQHLKYLEQVANDLLQVYRDANRSSRKTTTPRHFDVTWRIPPEYALEAALYQSSPENSEDPVRSAADNLRRLRDILKRYYLRALAALQPSAP